MNKKEIEKERAKIKAENPLLTDEQINDILAASEAEADGGKDAGSEEALHTPDSGLAQEREALEAEKAALVKEREELEAEKKRLAEKEEAIKAARRDTPPQDTEDAGSGESVLYECKTSCTFDGQYYRAGDTLTTDKKVPEDFFTAIK